MATNEELTPAVDKIRNTLKDYDLSDGLIILNLTADRLQIDYNLHILQVKEKKYKDVKGE